VKFVRNPVLHRFVFCSRRVQGRRYDDHFERDGLAMTFVSTGAASRAGDGVRSTTVQLDGEHARLTLSVLVDSGGALHQADVSLEP